MKPNKSIKFITGNKQKLEEVRRFLHPIKVEQLQVDLDEIQDLDPHKVLLHKVREAYKHHNSNFIVDDESVYLACLGGKLPGPLVKWFNITIGPKGLFNLTKKMRKSNAKAQSLIAYAVNKNKIIFFEGTTYGSIVKPRGSYMFGYDPIFQPAGSKKTFAELKSQGQFQLSPRFKSITKLKKYILQNEKR